MHTFQKLVAVALFGVVCAACSNNGGAPAPGASAPPASNPTPPPASAIPMQAPPAAGASAALPAPPPPANAPSLGVIMRRPSFAQAFAAMDGASTLPGWVKQGGTPMPSSRVQVEGKTMWLSHVCKTADCQGGQLFLLTDPAAHTMQGLFVETSGTTGASVRKFTWLGKPDATVQAFLKGQAAQG